MCIQILVALICILYINRIDGTPTDLGAIIGPKIQELNRNITVRSSEIYANLWREILKHADADTALRSLDDKTIENLLGLELVLLANGRSANTLWSPAANEKQSVDAKLKLLVRLLKERRPGWLDILNGHLLQLLEKFSTNIATKVTDESLQEILLHGLSARYELYKQAGVDFAVSPGFRSEVATVDSRYIDLPQLSDRAFDLFRTLMPTAHAVHYMKMPDYEGTTPHFHFMSLFVELNANGISYDNYKRVIGRKLKRAKLYRRYFQVFTTAPKFMEDLREYQKDQRGLMKTLATTPANIKAVSKDLNLLISELYDPYRTTLHDAFQPTFQNLSTSLLAKIQLLNASPNSDDAANSVIETWTKMLNILRVFNLRLSWVKGKDMPIDKEIAKEIIDFDHSIGMSQMPNKFVLALRSSDNETTVRKCYQAHAGTFDSKINMTPQDLLDLLAYIGNAHAHPNELFLVFSLLRKHALMEIIRPDFKWTVDMKTKVIDLVFGVLDHSKNSSFYWIEFENMIMTILERLAREHPELPWIAGFVNNTVAKMDDFYLQVRKAQKFDGDKFRAFWNQVEWKYRIGAILVPREKLSIAIKVSTIIFDLYLDGCNDFFWIAIVRNSFFGTVAFVSNYNDVGGINNFDVKRALAMPGHNTMIDELASADIDVFEASIAHRIDANAKTNHANLAIEIDTLISVRNAVDMREPTEAQSQQLTNPKYRELLQSMFRFVGETDGQKFHNIIEDALPEHLIRGIITDLRDVKRSGKSMSTILWRFYRFSQRIVDLGDFEHVNREIATSDVGSLLRKGAKWIEEDVGPAGYNSVILIEIAKMWYALKAVTYSELL